MSKVLIREKTCLYADCGPPMRFLTTVSRAGAVVVVFARCQRCLDQQLLSRYHNEYKEISEAEFDMWEVHES